MSVNFSFYSVDTRQPVCQFRSLSLFTYLMPVSRLPLQRVYAGSTSLFEYPIGPFLLFRALRFLDADYFSSSENLWSYLLLPRSHLSLSFVLCTHLTDYFFLYVLLRGLTSCVSSASLPCLTVSPVLLPLSTFSPALSSTNYSLSEWYALWCTFWICLS